jgi:hypothetical protein
LGREIEGPPGTVIRRTDPKLAVRQCGGVSTEESIVCELIEQALVQAEQAGLTPTEIHLGRRQMEEFLAWCASKPVGKTTGPGPTHSYNGIPIVEVHKETHRSVVAAEGRVLRID